MNASPETDYFLDTNILVYAFDRSAGLKHAIAVQLVEQCWENRNGCLSIQVLQEFYVNVTRKIAIPLELNTARQIVADLSHWHVRVPGAGDLREAIDIQQTYKLSFWNAMVLQSAARMGCRRFFTEDLSHGQKYGEILVVNPFTES